MSASTIEDHQQIVATLHLFASILDDRAWDRVGEVLTPDATAYGETGIDAVIDNSLRKHLGGCGPSQHLLGNHRIEVDGDHATSVTYARVFHRGSGDRSALSWECMGEYHDTWTRTAEGWRISARDLIVTIAEGDISVLQPG